MHTLKCGTVQSAPAPGGLAVVPHVPEVFLRVESLCGGVKRLQWRQRGRRRPPGRHPGVKCPEGGSKGAGGLLPPYGGGGSGGSWAPFLCLNSTSRRTRDASSPQKGWTFALDSPGQRQTSADDQILICSALRSIASHRSINLSLFSPARRRPLRASRRRPCSRSCCRS